MDWDEVKKRAMELSVEEDPCMKYWLKRIGKQSNLNKYILYLKRFCAFVGATPKQLVAKRKEQLESSDPIEKRRMEDAAIEFYNLALENLASNSAWLHLTAIRSFFKKHGLKLEFDVGDLEMPSVEARDYVPNAEDVRLMCELARNPRDRFIILAQFQSGFDRSTLASLRYQHISLGLARNEVPLPVEAIRVKGRRRKIITRTFLSPEAIEVLKIHLKERELKGEKFNAETPILKDMNGKGMSETRISKITSELMDHIKVPAGYRLRPHALRKAFSHALGRVRIDRDWKDLMMGHSVKLGAAYDLVPFEDLKEPYMQAYRQSLSVYGIANEKVGVGLFTKQMETLIANLLPILLKSPEMRRELEKYLSTKSEYEYNPLHEPKPIALIIKEQLEKLLGA